MVLSAAKLMTKNYLLTRSVLFLQKLFGIFYIAANYAAAAFAYRVIERFRFQHTLRARNAAVKVLKGGYKFRSAAIAAMCYLYLHVGPSVSLCPQARGSLSHTVKYNPYVPADRRQGAFQISRRTRLYRPP